MKHYFYASGENMHFYSLFYCAFFTLSLVAADVSEVDPYSINEAVSLIPDCQHLISDQVLGKSMEYFFEVLPHKEFTHGQVPKTLKAALLSSSESTLLSVTDGSMRIWDIESGEIMRELGANLLLSDTMAAWMNGEKNIISAHIPYFSSKTTIRIWDATTGTLVRTFGTENKFGHLFSNKGATLSSNKDGTRFLARDYNNKADWILFTAEDDPLSVLHTFDETASLVWDGNEVKVVPTEDNTRKAFCDCSVDRNMALHHRSGDIELCDTNTGKIIKKSKQKISGHLVSMSHDAKKLAMATHSYHDERSAISIWDVETGKKLWMSETIYPFLRSLFWNRDGTKLISLGGSNIYIHTLNKFPKKFSILQAAYIHHYLSTDGECDDPIAKTINPNLLQRLKEIKSMSGQNLWSCTE